MSSAQSYWNERWENQETGWDIGYPSTPLKEFIDTLTDKNLRILIPGCGNAYEAEYLFDQGFDKVYVVDFAAKALQDFRRRVPGFPDEQLICGDFFTLDAAPFDLILEQTFFCAIEPTLRAQYAAKMHQLLAPGGKLAGVLFNDPALGHDKPPFGGNAEEYKATFSPYFDFLEFRAAANSIPPRAGRELFIHFQRK